MLFYKTLLDEPISIPAPYSQFPSPKVVFLIAPLGCIMWLWLYCVGIKGLHHHHHHLWSLVLWPWVRSSTLIFLSVKWDFFSW